VGTAGVLRVVDEQHSAPTAQSGNDGNEQRPFSASNLDT
jgi:hypothetical protein